MITTTSSDARGKNTDAMTYTISLNYQCMVKQGGNGTYITSYEFNLLAALQSRQRSMRLCSRAPSLGTRW